jgi:hypothetical protein
LFQFQAVASRNACFARKKIRPLGLLRHTQPVTATQVHSSNVRGFPFFLCPMRNTLAKVKDFVIKTSTMLFHFKYTLTQPLYERIKLDSCRSIRQFG